jgi:DNA-binding NtrC family response regulator
MAKDNRYVVFVVDDDSKVLTMSKHYIEKNSEFEVEVQTFTTGEDALARLDMRPDAVVMDYYFNEEEGGRLNGAEVMAKIREKLPNTEVVMISGQENMEIALETIRNGAFDYIIKGENAIQRAQLSIEKILQSKNREFALRENNKNLRIVVMIMTGFLIALAAFLIFAQQH